MTEPESMRLFLVSTVAAALDVPADDVSVRPERREVRGFSGESWSFSVQVPPALTGLLLGPGGHHIEAVRTLAKVRALAMGWDAAVNVRVPRS